MMSSAQRFQVGEALEGLVVTDTETGARALLGDLGRLPGGYAGVPDPGSPAGRMLVEMVLNRFPRETLLTYFVRAGG